MIQSMINHEYETTVNRRIPDIQQVIVTKESFKMHLTESTVLHNEHLRICTHVHTCVG